MTQDEIIKMAREAGGSDVGSHGWTTWVGTQSTEFLERFAKLVAAKEREACAKKAEAQNCHMVAAAIRARGQA